MITAEAVIDLQALRHNYQILQACSPNSKLIAVIKGDGYGHGAINIAHALPEAEMFAVSRIEEAVSLRSEGITKPILLLEGCFCAEDLVIAAEQGMQTVIHHPEQLAAIETTPLNKPIKVWIKVDTGMHRLGVHPAEVSDYVTRLQSCSHVYGEPCFMSHFSCADETDADTTLNQLQCFNALTQNYPGEKSIANSAGILYWPDSHLDRVRSGIALYGISPKGDEPCERELTPVMTLRSKLIAVRDHYCGEPIGYGETWSSSRDTRIGVVAMGYGDGYPRLAPEGTPVFVNGRIVPIVGRVSMDMLTVDLGPGAEDKAGDPVVLWGKELPIEQVSQHIGTIAYELMIKLTKRVYKRYLHPS
ncbi:alanine racemase [Vibrio hangzhouensis]|uniref:Alanine racemase n=1 Tax=Vibrio hangzhouensis TaxID=462991 RepID=A0A1H5T3M6_9VIBR|nr:alanine racemase [Vibrio hangzhouensis]SEF57365.1 alanine racemase [Vibrio hangzhouensis]